MAIITELFRRQLRQEAEQWWHEGLINAEFYQTLSDRYQFAQIERASSQRFLLVLMGLGGILLGLGAITFVAANWQDWSRWFRLLFLLSLLIGVNFAGFSLWRRPADRRFHTLGHGLLLFGALLLGASLGLVSQMFHQTGPFYQLLLVWGLGVVAMAYSLSLVSLGTIAALLMGWGVLLASFTGLVNGPAMAGLFSGIIGHFPLVAGGLFLPLAYRCRSRWLFRWMAGLVVLGLWLGLALGGWASSGWLLALLAVLPTALLWGYSDRIWQRRPQAGAEQFRATAQGLAKVCLGLTLVFLSFKFAWADTIDEMQSLTPLGWQLLLDGVVLAGLAGLGWFQREAKPQQAIHRWAIGTMLLLLALLLVAHYEWRWMPGFDPFQTNVLAVLCVNGLLAWLAIGCIRDGLAIGKRNWFWGGMALLILQIISRMLEYDTGLLLKSIVFVLCGLGVILAGLRFERKTHPNLPSSQ